MAFVDDPALYLADFGVDCTGPAAAPFRALFNQPDVLAQLAEVSGVSRSYELVYPTASIALVRSDAVSVKDPFTDVWTAYAVREKPRQLGDGAFTSAILSRV